MSQVIDEAPADVVCLGLGVMSGIVATELAIAGYSVVGIEKGPFWDYSTDFAMSKYDEWGVGLMHKFDHPLSLSTYTIRNNVNQFGNPSRRYTYPLGFMAIGHGVGGAAQHYGGGFGRYAPWSYRMYSDTVSKYGASFLTSVSPDQDVTDWPLTYADYTPYYDTFEKAWAVTGTNQDPYIPNANFPLPPHPLTPVAQLFQSSAESLGYALHELVRCAGERVRLRRVVRRGLQLPVRDGRKGQLRLSGHPCGDKDRQLHDGAEQLHLQDQHKLIRTGDVRVVL